MDTNFCRAIDIGDFDLAQLSRLEQFLSIGACYSAPRISEGEGEWHRTDDGWLIYTQKISAQDYRTACDRFDSSIGIDCSNSLWRTYSPNNERRVVLELGYDKKSKIAAAAAQNPLYIKEWAARIPRIPEDISEKSEGKESVFEKALGDFIFAASPVYLETLEEFFSRDFARPALSRLAALGKVYAVFADGRAILAHADCLPADLSGSCTHELGRLADLSALELTARKSALCAKKHMAKLKFLEGR